MLSTGELTRNESYFALLPDMPGRRGEVLRFIASCGERGATRQEIADGLGWKINCVTGRRKGTASAS